MVSRDIVGIFALLFSTATSFAECEECTEARALWDAGKCTDALPLLKKAAKKHKGNVEVASLQVACYTTLGKPKNVAKPFAAFWEGNPSPDDILWLRSAVEAHASPTPMVEGRFVLPEGATPPIPLVAGRPVPSAEAQEFRVAGAVVVGGVLRADGTLGELAEQRTGDWSRQVAFRFGESAIASLSGWRYFPALKDGKPVSVPYLAIVRFSP